MKVLRHIVFKIISELKGKTKLPTQKITENIFTVRCGYVNFFIYKEKDTYICIDSGFNEQHIKKHLEELKINPEKISMIFLTHSDYDHFGGTEVFQNAEIYISQNEKDMLLKGIHRPFGINKNSKILDKINFVQDNQIVKNSSIKVRCILTPGHTEGSMCYLINDKNLFVGDTCKIENDQIITLSNVTNMDTETQEASIEKLRKIKNIKMTLTGHYGYKKGF